MKILVVCQYYYPEPFRISDICETLVERGNDVTVLTGLPNYPEGKVLDEYRHGKRKKETINGVNILRSFEIGRGNDKLKLFLNYISFSASGSLKALFLKEKFDVVFVYQLSPVLMCIPAIIYKKKHNKKMVLYCLDLWPDSLVAGGVERDSLVYKTFLRVSKRIYRSADKILVTSLMFKEYFKNTLDMEINNIEHAPQHAEDIFHHNEEDGLISIVSDNETKISNFVFAGNIGDMQSIETIIKTANELRNHSNIIFHIVGDGSKLDTYQRDCVDLYLKNIVFHGRQPISEMPRFYGMADAMLITLKDDVSLSYTLPGKVQSYMAAGKPIIGAINGETKRVIEDAKCGVCCAAEDYKGLAQLIIAFRDREDKEEMAKNALKFYKENYSKEKIITAIEEELRKIYN